MSDDPKNHRIIKAYLVGDEKSTISLWCTVSSSLLNSIVASNKALSLSKNNSVQSIVVMPSAFYFIAVLRSPSLLYCDYSDSKNSWKVKTLYLQGDSEIKTNQLAWIEGTKLMASSFSKGIHYLKATGLKCHPSCKTCSLFIDYTGCTSCNKGSYFDQGICRKCHKSCSDCKLMK